MSNLEASITGLLSPQTELAPSMPSVDELTGVIAKTENAKSQALSNSLRRYSPDLILGGVLNVSYISTDILEVAHPGLTGVALLLSIFGFLAGAFTVGEAFHSLYECGNALKEGNKLLFARLLWDFASKLAMGIILTVASLTLFGIQTAIAAFFIANPWLLPILFFAISIPTVFEVLYRINKIRTETDLTSQLQLQNQNLSPEDIWRRLTSACKKEDPQSIMESLKAEIGVDAALALFKLLRDLCQKSSENNSTNPEDSIKEFKTEIKRWNRDLAWRLFIRFLCLISLAISVMVYIPQVNTKSVDTSSDVFLGGSEGIALLLDIFRPTTRDTPVVV